MRNKKSKDNDKTPEQQALERRVDEMMDVEFDPSKQTVENAPQVPKDSQPMTAPVLPKDLQKNLPPDPAPKIELVAAPVEPAKPVEPLKIDKLDEMTAEVEAEQEAVDEPQVEASMPEATEEVETDNDQALEDSTNLDDVATDKAVDEIEAGESDTVLAVADAKQAKKVATPKPKVGPASEGKFKRLLRSKWTWIILGLLLIAVFALPQTRYTILGLFIKKTVTVQVKDSKTNLPVSGATVDLAGASAKTDGSGTAKLSASLGQSTLSVSKKYYLTSSGKYFVGLKSAPAANVKLVATGRLVPITVTNYINGLPVANAQLRLAGTTARTDKKGQAIVALPVKQAKVSAKISAPGYNQTDIEVTVTDHAVAANKFKLTPAGQIYFLSNQSGTVDVVKTNLDGTGRKVVLAGTGKEDKSSTVLLASRDWKYLVLKARREGGNAGLFLIDTTTDKATPFDNSDSGFNLVGWYNHNFVYDVAKNNQPLWQTGHEQIKSYDADHLQLNQLDQAQSEGDQNSYAYQNFSNFYIADGLVMYTVQWQGGSSIGTPNDLSGKNDAIRGVQANGQAKKDYLTFASNAVGIIQANLYEPQSIYYSVPNRAYSSTAFYKFENQAIKQVTDIDQATFNQVYPTYLISPSGNQTFWSDLRDGKNAMFVGDEDAKNAKQVASLSGGYSAYGWFSESYLLISKGGSELYIIPSTTLGTNQQPIKISDYYKPSQSLTGYGYGYGGL